MLSKPAVLLRITVRRRVPGVGAVQCHSLRAQFRAHHRPPQGLSRDPRLSETGGVIQDDFAVIRENYQVPKNPIVLAHGLLGFDEIHPAGSILPGIQYWSGIVDALAKKNVEVITVAVPPSECIEVRAQRLAEAIERSAGGRAVNIIAHSMGGLDSRYMLTRLHPPRFLVKSLTTIATPHHGSAFADYIFERIGPANIPRLYKALDFFGLETGAFQQLSIKYMAQNFNPQTPDVQGVKYYSYGASLRPQWTSVFRHSHNIIDRVQGENDGLVSVESSKWGVYKGTLQDVSHLDLINWTNRIRWYFLSLTGKRRNFNAIAFYLGISDMLAREGL